MDKRDKDFKENKVFICYCLVLVVTSGYGDKDFKENKDCFLNHLIELCVDYILILLKVLISLNNKEQDIY